MLLTYTKYDEYGDDVQVAKIPEIENYAIHEVRDPETGYDAEYGESGDPQRLRLEPDETEYEDEAAHCE